MAKGVEVRLYDASGTAQANLTGLQCVWFDEAEPKDFSAPRGVTYAATTDSDGDLILNLDNVTHLSSGDYGILVVYKLDGSDHKDSPAFISKLQVSSVTGGTTLGLAASDWVRNPSWLTMTTITASENKFVGLHAVIIVLSSPTEEHILGILSLIVWTMILLVTVEYAWLAMSLGKRGEGGTIVLSEILTPLLKGGRQAAFVTFLTYIGISLIIGDGVITPAISILSAVEGLLLIPGLETLKTKVLILIAGTIAIALFAVQRKGTEKVAAAFGPLMILWFGALATAGLVSISEMPSVLRALNPIYALRFLSESGLAGFFVLSEVTSRSTRRRPRGSRSGSPRAARGSRSGRARLRSPLHIYVLSATAGSIADAADIVTTGHRRTVMAIGAGSNAVDVVGFAPGAAIP